MSKDKPVLTPTEAMSKAYEKLLLLSVKEFKLLKKKGAPLLHQIIDQSSEKLSELGELTSVEAEKIAAYLKRDLKEAAQHMADNKDFKEWLAMDTELIEDYLLDHMMQAADQTTVELAQLKAQAEAAEYHSGEIIGPGVLVCDQCAEQLHFSKPGHIPPCPKCKGGHFHRLICR